MLYAEQSIQSGNLIHDPSLGSALNSIPLGGMVADMRRILTMLAILPLLFLAACGGSSDHNDADVEFAQQMIPHHQQAGR